MKKAKRAKPLQVTEREKIPRPDIAARKQPVSIEPAVQGKAPKRSDRVGLWTLVSRLGRGGNGEVWLAVANGKQVAIKLLTKPKPMAYARFRAEVGALKLTAGIRGVLPVLGENLPPELGSARPWYAMPVATPLLKVVAKSTTRAKVLAIAEAAETLAMLHDKKIVHRDIKPANLLDYEGRCHIADFGLVDYPERPDITIGKEQIGPRWTMAPEVRREGSDADAFPADVYSLAKTLWIVLTGEQKGFDGQYHPGGELSIKKYCGDLYITPLEDLLSEGTDNDPKGRPTMRAFAERLHRWLRISGRFPDYNPLQWAEVQSRFFPLGVPARAVWEDIDDIVTILNVLGGTSNLNHLFFPSGGGLDLQRAVRSTRENGCIELFTDGYISVVKPTRLLFESFGDDPEWNYFRLETGVLEPSGAYAQYLTDWYEEDLTEIGGQTYVDSSCWDCGEYESKPLPEGSRLLTRYFRGSFVIFQKTSFYNQVMNSYDAGHNEMDADEFRARIATEIGRSEATETTKTS